jgi:hypothetical protein
MRIINKREFERQDQEPAEDIFRVADLPGLMDQLAAKRRHWMLTRQREKLETEGE